LRLASCLRTRRERPALYGRGGEYDAMQQRCADRQRTARMQRRAVALCRRSSSAYRQRCSLCFARREAARTFATLREYTGARSRGEYARGVEEMPQEVKRMARLAHEVLATGGEIVA